MSVVSIWRLYPEGHDDDVVDAVSDLSANHRKIIEPYRSPALFPL